MLTNYPNKKVQVSQVQGNQFPFQEATAHVIQDTSTEWSVRFSEGQRLMLYKTAMLRSAYPPVWTALSELGTSYAQRWCESSFFCNYYWNIESHGETWSVWLVWNSYFLREILFQAFLRIDNFWKELDFCYLTHY